jgi:tripartite ATP-independent transporter DctM subunit
MSPELIIILMISSMVALLLTGRQIFAIVGAVGVIFSLALWGAGAMNMPFQGTTTVLKWYPLITLPCFIFMGLTLSRSGVADALYQAMYYWFGRLKGGLAMGTVGLCALIACMSGVNIAATVTATTIGLPAMLKRNYDKRMVTGSILAGGALGFLIPPSIVFIFFAVIARVSVGHLWLAGLLPGLMLAGLYIMYIGIRCNRAPHLGPPITAEEQVGWGEKWRSLRSGLMPIFLIFIVLGLFFGGVTSLVECSAIGSVGALVCAAINRKLNWRIFSDILEETMRITSVFMWIVMAAIMYGHIFDGLGAVHGVEALLGTIGAGKWGTIAIMMASFVGMGTVLDDTAMLFIVAPLYVPIVAHLGFDLVWYGVLYVVNCQMAFITPPFGYNIFLVRAIAPKEVTLGDIYTSVWPFVGLQAAGLGILMAFPQIALFLPNLFFGS